MNQNAENFFRIFTFSNVFLWTDINVSFCSPAGENDGRLGSWKAKSASTANDWFRLLKTRALFERENQQEHQNEGWTFYIQIFYFFMFILVRSMMWFDRVSAFRILQIQRRPPKHLKRWNEVALKHQEENLQRSSAVLHELSSSSASCCSTQREHFQLSSSVLTFPQLCSWQLVLEVKSDTPGCPVRTFGLILHTSQY